jgi:hypothetical protein
MQYMATASMDLPLEEGTTYTSLIKHQVTQFHIQSVTHTNLPRDAIITDFATFSLVVIRLPQVM